MNAVQAAVDLFYSKVMKDDRINHFFAHINMEKQSGKLSLLAYAFGAPPLFRQSAPGSPSAYAPDRVHFQRCR
jgi:truncated hemoglobin YjbI